MKETIAVVNAKLDLTFDLGGAGANDTRSLLENAIAYLQTLLEFEEPPRLQAATGLQVKVVETTKPEKCGSSSCCISSLHIDHQRASSDADDETYLARKIAT